MNEENKTYSIALHLRRVIYEDAYVAVPVTDAIMKPNGDGTGTVDYEAFVAEAVKLGEYPGVDWQVEGAHTEAHPVQGPHPEGRRIFDSHYSQHEAE